MEGVYVLVIGGGWWEVGVGIKTTKYCSNSLEQKVYDCIIIFILLYVSILSRDTFNGIELAYNV